MNPEELDRWSAEKVMGWIDNADSMWSKDAGYKMAGEKLCTHVMAIKDWQPSDPKTGQLWLVVEKMREFGFNFHFEIMGTRNLIRFWKIVRPATQSYSGEVKEGISKDSNACLAILKAAYQAMAT